MKLRTLLVALSLLVVGFATVQPAAADHSADADTCKEGDGLEVYAFNEDSEDLGVSGEYACGGGGSACAPDGESSCRSAEGGAWFDDGSPVCRGDADHVRCSSYVGGNPVTSLIQDLLRPQQSSSFGEALDSAALISANDAVRSVTTVWDSERAFTCIDGTCMSKPVTCVGDTCGVML